MSLEVFSPAQILLIVQTTAMSLIFLFFFLFFTLFSFYFALLASVFFKHLLLVRILWYISYLFPPLFYCFLYSLSVKSCASILTLFVLAHLNSVDFFLLSFSSFFSVSFFCSCVPLSLYSTSYLSLSIFACSLLSLSPSFSFFTCLLLPFFAVFYLSPFIYFLFLLL